MSRGASVVLGAMILLAGHALGGVESGPSPDSRPATGRPGRITVGAIRWDAWFGNTGIVGTAVHRTLGPRKWHDRLPFYARVTGDDEVLIDGTPQAIIDREIEYAASAGIDYWAFVLYPPQEPMSLALERYLASPVRSKVNFCLVTECGRWKLPGFVDRVAGLMAEPGYQRLSDGRPLLYLGFIAEDQLAAVDGIDGLRAEVDRLRAAARGRGLGASFLVIMDFYPPQGRRWLDALGADAIGSYAFVPRQGAICYARLAAGAEQFWEACRETGAAVVPIVMTGWDPRPRVERPVPWGGGYGRTGGEVDHALPGTPAEIAGHLANALRWVERHPDAAAGTILIYAWNEFDEGGWLVPTLAEGSARLEAVARLLRPVTSAPAGNNPPSGGHDEESHSSVDRP